MKTAFFWSFLTNYLSIAINFVSVVVLARMLTPSEIGTYAIAGAVFSIAQIFRDMGISGYLLREKELSPEKFAGALTIVWILCGTIALIMFFMARPIANFYTIPQLTLILQVLSLNILLIPFGTTGQTHLRRAMNFKLLGGIELTSQTVHLIVAVILAFYNFGALSLALASLATTICTLTLVNLACRNQERYLPKLQHVKEVLPHISMIGFANILSTLNSRATPLIIGKVLSNNAVAIMDKALATIELLNQLLMQAIQKVLLPFFTNMREQKGNIPAAYLSVTNYTLLFALPFLFYISVLSEFVVLTLFGEQWKAAIPLVPIFALSSAFGMTVRYFSEISISMGLEKILMKLNLSVFIVKVIAIVSVSQFGLQGIAFALLAISFVKAVVIYYLLSTYLHIGFKSFFLEMKGTLLITVLSTIPYVIGNYLGLAFVDLKEVIGLFITVVLTWLSSVFLLRHKARYEIAKLLNR